MKRHDLNLKKYNISTVRYRELYYFCLQYDDRRAEISELRNPSQPAPDGIPKGNTTSDPTSRNAMRAAIKSKENEIMEQAAMEAGAELYSWLLDSVKYDLKYDYLRAVMNIPCNEKVFNRIRHKFYYILDQKRYNL